MRNVMEARIGNAVARMISRASEATISEVLKESTDIGTMVRLISSVGIDDVLPINPLMRAYLRGIETKQHLLEEAGGVLTTGEVARLLGISEQGVLGRLDRKGLLAVTTGNNRRKFPACQFTADGVVPGIKEFLSVCNVEDPWSRLALLLDPQPALAGRSILNALRSGDRDAALRVAGSFAS
jgi:hypothetical protein